MNEVFEETTLAGLRLKNRIIRSATLEARGDNKGRPSEKLANLYVRLARGGVGAIVTGGVNVQQNGKFAANSLMLDSDEFLEDFKKLAAPVKKLGVPLIVQLVHGGGQTSRTVAGTELVGPSRKKYPLFASEARELTEPEIEQVVDAFVRAIRRARQVGFDGVQLHAAHGYLLSAFLSPRVNRRTDRWGGSTENRARIIEEIVRRARQEVGDYPILAKFSAYDRDRGGVSAEEGIRIAELLEKAGLDALETSCGSADDGFNYMRVAKMPTEALFHFVPKLRDSSPLVKLFYKTVLPLSVKKWLPLHNYNIETAEKIKARVKIPVIAVGGIRTITDIRRVIAGGKADYVSMSRPFIIEPDIVNKFFLQTQERSKCIDCGYCFFGVLGAPLKCYHGKI